MKKVLKSQILLIIALVGFSSGFCYPNSQIENLSIQIDNTNQYQYESSVTESNPYRGFVPFMGHYNSFPHSMEFFYVPLKDLMNDFDSFTFQSGLENHLNEISSRGHQSIFRVYLDYPGSPSGIPDFLFSGLKTYEYDEFGGGISPDYMNETLINCLESFIEELGRNYDGDSRIAFIQVGLLGHWGEWHTYPNEEWFPGEDIQARILSAFDNVFNSTHILARYPEKFHKTENYFLGYHDDSFAYSTIGKEEWFFHNQLIAAELEECWRTFPIGGEVRPEIQKDMWSANPPKNMQDYEECVALTHPSWLINHQLFQASFTSSEYKNAQEGAAKLGYQLFIKSARISVNSTSFTLSCSISNRGNSPFYYPLKLVILSHLANQTQLKLGEKLIKLLPDETMTFSNSFELSEMPIQDFKIALKLESSQTEIAIRFANKRCGDNGELLISEIYIGEEEQTSIRGYPLLALLSIFLIFIVSGIIKKKQNIINQNENLNHRRR